MEKLDQLKKELKSKLETLSFKELVELINKTTDSEARGMILDTMESNYEEEFINWIG